MKIRLAILEKDKNYLNRLVSVFNTKYSDKFEVYSFTDYQITMSVLNETKIDILIANEDYEIDFSLLPKKCGFAYLVETNDIETLNNQATICKYQKADLIYKQILSIYSENVGNITGLKISNDKCKTIAFGSVSGGVGSSTMAAACAVRFASLGKKVLFLSLEKFGSSDLFFEAEGQFDMSDIIFALKSKKTNISLKLESCVKQDQSGVYFYSKSKNVLDMMELNEEDIQQLITSLKFSETYDYIILDIDFGLQKDKLDLYKQVDSLVMINDGSEISNEKFIRAFEALTILGNNHEDSIIEKMFLIYNKFSNKTSKALTNINVKNIGGAPRYEHATTKQIINKLIEMTMFDQLF